MTRLTLDAIGTLAAEALVRAAAPAHPGTRLSMCDIRGEAADSGRFRRLPRR